MKLRLLCGILMLSAVLGSTKSIGATFNEIATGLQLGLCLDDGFDNVKKTSVYTVQLQMPYQTGSYEYTEPTTENQYLGISTTAIVIWMMFLVVVVFLLMKWAWLALELTQYELFLMDMDEYFHRHWSGMDCIFHFPYEYHRAIRYLFTNKWTVKDVLHPFDYFDFQKWQKDKTWRPYISPTVSDKDRIYTGETENLS